MPRPLAFIILAIVAVGVSFGVAGVVAESREHHAAEKAANKTATATAPAAETPAATAPAAPAPAEPTK